MKKWWILLATSIGLIPIGWGFIHFLPAIGIFSHVHYDLKAQPDWRVYENKDYGISVESPFFIRWEPKSQPTRSGKTLESLFGISDVNENGFLTSISVLRFKEGNESFNSDDLFNMMESDLKSSSYTEAKWESRSVTCSGMPATLLTGSYLSAGEPYYFSKLLVILGNQYWKVETGQRNGDMNGENRIRVIQSVKIQPKNP